MRIIENIIKVFLGIVILYVFCYYFFVYKDLILSIGKKGALKGKIVYSVGRHNINIIELPSGESKTIYTAKEAPNRYLESVGSPCLSPDGERVIFSKKEYRSFPSSYKLYMMDSDGVNVRKILDLGDASILSPSYSPDGTKIAFVVKKEGLQGLYITDVHSPSNYRRICDIKPSGSQPSWTSDGRKIAFISSEYISKQLGPGVRSEAFTGRIFLTDIEGGHQMC